MNPLLQLLTGLTALAVMGSVNITDPTGDSVGDGTIVAPTAPRYANNAIFDLQDVELEVVTAAGSGSIILLPTEPPNDEEVGSDAGVASQDGSDPVAPSLGQSIPEARSVLTVTLGAVDVNETSALGFGSVVIDVYLDAAAGGHAVTLDGPDMLLPAGRGWEYAVRLTPDGATGYRYVAPDEAATLTEPEAVAEEAQADGAASATDATSAPQPVFESVPVGVALVGSTLVIEMPWQFESEVTVYALTGVHDPFNPTGWRPLADRPSPWAYSGGEQVVPVIDLLAPNQEAQERALRTGVLPLPTVPARDAGTLWLLLMALGLATAVAGLVLRRRVPSDGRVADVRSGKTPLRTGLPPDPEPPATPLKKPAVREPEAVAESVGLAGSVATAAEPTDEPDPAASAQAPAAALAEETAAEPVDGMKAAPGDDTMAQSADETTMAQPADETKTAPGDETKMEAVDGATAQPALSGVSAFDSFVLYEQALEDDLEDEGFDELSDRRTDPLK